MITTKLMGGLGNQLFMMSAAIAFGKKHNMHCEIPMVVENPHYPGQKPYIFPGVHYSDAQYSGMPVYNEPFFHYQEIPWKESLCLVGYFQSGKYFEGFRDEILKAFGFEYKRNEDVVAIHVRRGDYLRLPDYHPTVTIEYITAGIDKFLKAGYKKFKVFSDDMPWCKENINQKNFPYCEIEYSEGKNEYEDLTLASHCDHIIGSNSTFSWWAHYLCQYPNKRATFPANWFGPFLKHDTKDLYPEGCIKL